MPERGKLSREEEDMTVMAKKNKTQRKKRVAADAIFKIVL